MREHFIPVRRAELAALLEADSGLPGELRAAWAALARLLAATLHFEYQARLEGLKEAYFPFDPDRDTRPVAGTLAPEGTAGRLGELVGQFTALLERGNFRPVGQPELEAATGTGTWGIPTAVDFGVFEQLAVYVRGEGEVTRKVRGGFPWYKKQPVQVPVWRRLVLLVKLRPHPDLPPEVDTGTVHLKLFKDIPRQDVRMLLPGARVRLTTLDTGKIGVPLATGVGLAGWRILRDVLLLAGGVSPALLWALATGAAGYGYRSYHGYRRTQDRYHLRLTRNLYYQCLDSNAGVLTRLLDEAEEQEAREALLAYYFLWRRAPAGGWTHAELDAAIEEYLRGLVAGDVDFEVDDALAKLVRWGLARPEGDRYEVVPVEEALERLDAAWDAYFPHHREGGA